MPSQIDCRHGSRESLHVPSVSRDVSSPSPSAIPVVKEYTSASAELKLTDCCVLDHAERVAPHHCVTPPFVLLLVWCCPAQSLSMYTFTNCGNVLISIKHFALGTFKNIAVRCASRSSHVRPVPLSLVFSSHLESSRSRVLQTKHGNHVSGVLRICLNRVSTSRSHDHSAKNAYHGLL